MVVGWRSLACLKAKNYSSAPACSSCHLSKVAAPGFDKNCGSSLVGSGAESARSNRADFVSVASSAASSPDSVPRVVPKPFWQQAE